jgi:glutathione S-transferase
MKLLGAIASPYVRKVRVVMAEKKLDYQFILEDVWSADTQIGTSNRLGEKPFCSGIHFSLSDVAVGCALGYLDFRFPAIDWRTSYPNLSRLAEKLNQRQSFIDTRPS